MTTLHPALHPALAHVATLLGTWTGRGRGDYPTIESFEYDETITFGHVGKPFLAYAQRTTSVPPDGSPPAPLHAETGYWRFPDLDRVELVIAHPSGIAEVDAGSLRLDGDAVVIEVASTAIAVAPTAKSVVTMERVFRFAGDTLDYEVRMAAVGEPLQYHLDARLSRTA